MTPLPADKALDAYFLDARAKLLDLASALDRIARGGTTADPRRARIDAALRILLDSEGVDRAADVQRLFSLEYDSAWKIPEPRY